MDACVICAHTHPDVEVYTVGVLEKILAVRRAYGSHVAFSLRAKAREHAWRALRNEGKRAVIHVRHGNWRAVKNQFNGYMAEPYHFPAHMRRCGTGWTYKRAMRSLRRNGWTR